MATSGQSNIYQHFCFYSFKFVDLFEKLVPLAVHNALDAFESRKVEIISREVGKLREHTQLMNR